MIDWTQPIELDTVPPRPAQMTAMRSWGTAEVDADWDADGVIYPLLVSGDGTTQIPGVPTVRNVTTAPDLDSGGSELTSEQISFVNVALRSDMAAELAEALRCLGSVASEVVGTFQPREVLLEHEGKQEIGVTQNYGTVGRDVGQKLMAAINQAADTLRKWEAVK